MDGINGLDIVIAGVILISGIFAFCRGFISEMLGIGSWIVAGAAGVYLLPYVSPLAEKHIRNPTLANAAAGVASSIIVLVVLTLICSFITNRIRRSSLNRIDHSLGFLFGCLRGLIILMLMYFMLFVLSPKTLEDLGNGSKLYPYLDDVCLRVKEHMPESLFDNPPSEKAEEGKKKDAGAEELKGLLRAIGKDEIELATQEIQSLPKDDPLRQMLEEKAKESGKSWISSFFSNLKPAAKPARKIVKKQTAADDGDKELFDKLNGVAVESKTKEFDILYGDDDKEDLNRLILENVDEKQDIIP